MGKTNSRRILIFAGLGLLSGLLTSFSCYFTSPIGGFFKEAWPLFLGVIFGTVFAVCAWALGICRSIWRLLGFATASLVAYAFAMLGGMSFPIDPEYLNRIFGQQIGPDLAVCLAGGLIGGAIVFTSFVTLVAWPNSWTKSAVKLTAFTITSGLLGMLAWTTGLLFSALFYVVWQTGAGIMLAYLLPPLEATGGIANHSEIGEQKIASRVARQVVAVFVTLSALVGFTFLARREMKRYQFGVSYRAKQEEAQRRAIAERPPLEKLQEIPAQRLEQILILHSIHGLEIDPTFEKQTGARSPGGYGRPPSLAFYASYGSLDGSFHPGYIPIVRAQVTVYPNPEWAQFLMRDFPTFNASILDPERTIPVTISGNRIIMNTSMRYPNGTGDLYFLWPSGERLIVIIFQKNEDDEFLKEYLELHPSSL